jgi:uncharacterized membrane protein SpoIIM required for sporulation
MVLESLIGVRQAEVKPMYTFLLGFLYASIGIFLSLWIFKSQASLVMVFLIVFACLPLIYNTLRFEAEKDLTANNDNLVSKQHFLALRAFMYLFVGIVLAMTLWYVILPTTVILDLFSSQISTIHAINGHSATGSATSWNFLSLIVINNLKVLIFCILFSFFYGAGAIFILTWNASVISAAIGSFIRAKLAEVAGSVGFVKVAIYLQIFSLGLLRYLTHGVFEILAYFIGGMAGGLISVAMVSKQFEGDSFKLIIKDAVDLMILAILVIIIAGLIEVFVTPLFF